MLMANAPPAPFDLNLLRALQALLAERHVTRAAARLGITQPAMSHALARLRTTLADPILVRTRAGMAPTPRAEAIGAHLERVLADVDELVATPAAFDPSTSTRRFRVATSDYIELVLFPKLLARVWEEGPSIDVRVVNLGLTMGDHLTQGEVDLGIGPLGTFRSLPRGTKAQKLFDDEFVCVLREDHPFAKRRMTLDDFCALPHALVSPSGQSGSYVDTALAKLGRTRRVAVELPHFLVAPHIVQETDAVLTLAKRLADVLAPMLGLRRVPPPIEVPGFTMSMVWHERNHADPAHTWLRGALTKVAAKLGR